MRCLLAMAVMVLSLTGCENSVDPLAEGADDVFAIHGFLDVDADSQSVRVSSMETYEEGRLPYEDVEVRSLAQDEPPVVWSYDPSVILEDGSRIYRARTTPTPGTEYRLQVLRGSSVATEGLTRVPAPPAVDAGPLEGPPEFLSQKVFIRGFPSAPFNLYIEYDVRVPGEPEIETVLVEYGRTGSSLANRDWVLDVFLTRDRDTATRALGLPESVDPELVQIRARVDVLSPEWAQGGVRIEGGHGFFGSVGRYRTAWELPRDTLATIGFIDAQR